METTPAAAAERSVPIYLDYNATTPLDTLVSSSMLPFLAGGLEGGFGNPSSAYTFALKTREALASAREQVASLVNCESAEVLFCSGGSESINHVIKSIVMDRWKHQSTRPHVITTAIEHVAVLEALAWCADAMSVELLALCGKSSAADGSGSGMGFCDVTVLPVDGSGIVQPSSLKAALRPSTCLVTVMLANNETGALQPIEEMGRIVEEANRSREHNLRVLLHTDASQALGKRPVDVKQLGIHLVSIAGHKLYAPKGCGATIIREGVHVPTFIHGASQEKGRRAGTENVAYAVALGTAAKLCRERLIAEMARLEHLRQGMITTLFSLCESKGLPQPFLNGPLGRHFNRGGTTAFAASTAGELKSCESLCLPNTLSIAFPGAYAASMVDVLAGTVAVSAGSACHASLPPSATKAQASSAAAAASAVGLRTPAHRDPRTGRISHVLSAMGCPKLVALCTLRITLGRWSTADEMNLAALKLVEAASICQETHMATVLRDIAKEEGTEALLLYSKEAAVADSKDAAVAAPSEAHGKGASASSVSSNSSSSSSSSSSTSSSSSSSFSSAVRGIEKEIASSSSSSNVSLALLPVSTAPIFLSDTYLFSCASKIVAILPLSPEGVFFGGACIGPSIVPPGGGQPFAMILNATVAHPQGGGQPSDKGVILSDEDSEHIFFFTAVRTGTTVPGPGSELPPPPPIIHYGTFLARPSSPSSALTEEASAEALLKLAAGSPPLSSPFPPELLAAKWSHGSACGVHIDRGHRLLCAKLHSGGHLLDMAFQRLFQRGYLPHKLLPSKGYHFLDAPYVEYVGEVPASLREALPPTLTTECDAICKENQPTLVKMVDTRELPNYGMTEADSAHLPKGKDVRLVMVGGPGNACLCGGTHVAATGELSGLLVTKVAVKKGITKISYKFN